jgi:type II secretory pathway pseudopilin PulG
MGMAKKNGFTIIETTLAVAITGLLVAGILFSTGNAVGAQRYRDSVSSLQSFLQAQYALVSNVRNDNLGNTSCQGVVQPRGQSNCVILGLYITNDNPVAIGTKTTRLLVKTITGVIPTSGSPDNLDDVAVFTFAGLNGNPGYNAVVSTIPAETSSYDIEWSSSIVKVGSNDPMSFSLLILRSPSSGYVKTFINKTTAVLDNQIQSMLITQSSLGNSLKMCITDFDLSVPKKRAVHVNANASSASGVELLNEETSGCEI